MNDFPRVMLMDFAHVGQASKLMIATTVEAILGAVYLDGDLESVKGVMKAIGLVA